MSFLQHISKPVRTHITNSFFLSNLANRNLSQADMGKRWMSHLEIENGQHFRQKLAEKEAPILAYFYKPQCHFCKVFEDKLGAVMKNTDHVHFIKVNVENTKDIVERYNIEAVPTVMGFRNGKEVDMVKGNVDKEVIENIVSKLKWHDGYALCVLQFACAGATVQTKAQPMLNGSVDYLRDEIHSLNPDDEFGNIFNAVIDYEDLNKYHPRTM
ncbi:hypothetical protein M8J76_014634 [Diaphorina citri]|nr:hypothetical protein M8J76_014634 [Diaphorina citri]